MQGQLVWSSKTEGLVRGSIVVDRINHTVLTHSESGHFQCFTAAKGGRTYTRRKGAVSNHIAPYWSNGALVVSDSHWHVFGVNPKDGTTQWASRLRSPTAWRPSPMSAAPGADFIVITRGGNLATFSAQGTKLREQKTNLHCFAPAAIADGHAVFLTLSGQLLCYPLHA
jgi:outer membrane protein assembly factor BamB